MNCEFLIVSSITYALKAKSELEGHGIFCKVEKIKNVAAIQRHKLVAGNARTPGDKGKALDSKVRAWNPYGIKDRAILLQKTG